MADVIGPPSKINYRFKILNSKMHNYHRFFNHDLHNTYHTILLLNIVLLFNVKFKYLICIP